MARTSIDVVRHTSRVFRSLQVGCMRARRVRAAAWLSLQGASIYAWSTAPTSFSWQRSSVPRKSSKSTCTPQPDLVMVCRSEQDYALVFMLCAPCQQQTNGLQPVCMVA